MTTLTVWGRANSINVQKVLWLLAELDVPYRHIPAGGAHGGLDTPEFLAMNPCGRVPVIQDGDCEHGKPVATMSCCPLTIFMSGSSSVVVRSAS